MFSIACTTTGFYCFVFLGFGRSGGTANVVLLQTCESFFAREREPSLLQDWRSLHRFVLLPMAAIDHEVVTDHDTKRTGMNFSSLFEFLERRERVPIQVLNDLDEEPLAMCLKFRETRRLTLEEARVSLTPGLYLELDLKWCKVVSNEVQIDNSAILICDSSVCMNSYQYPIVLEAFILWPYFSEVHKSIANAKIGWMVWQKCLPSYISQGRFEHRFSRYLVFFMGGGMYHSREQLIQRIWLLITP